MINDDELRNIRSIFFEHFKDDIEYLRDNRIEFYIMGSKCFPFISKPRDVDIVVTYYSDENIFSDVRILIKINELLDKYNWHLLYENQNCPRTNHYLYAPFYINIFSCEPCKLSIFDLDDKLYDRIKSKYEYYMRIKHYKRMYDFIFYYYIIKNNSYDLTQEQINKIESWHDGKRDWPFLKQIINELRFGYIEPDYNEKGEYA